MKRKKIIINRTIALFLVFILSTNGFAAIVSDNDGSAFVTKAEFDSLKKSFNRQIDDYNTSIDNKIDGAIASYLAGIDIASPPSQVFSDEDLKAVRFKNKAPDTKTDTGCYSVAMERTACIKGLNTYKEHKINVYSGTANAYKRYNTSTGRSDAVRTTVTIQTYKSTSVASTLAQNIMNSSTLTNPTYATWKSISEWGSNFIVADATTLRAGQITDTTRPDATDLITLKTESSISGTEADFVPESGDLTYTTSLVSNIKNVNSFDASRRGKGFRFTQTGTKKFVNGFYDERTIMNSLIAQYATYKDNSGTKTSYPTSVSNDNPYWSNSLTSTYTYDTPTDFGNSTFGSRKTSNFTSTPTTQYLSAMLTTLDSVSSTYNTLEQYGVNNSSCLAKSVYAYNENAEIGDTISIALTSSDATFTTNSLPYVKKGTGDNDKTKYVQDSGAGTVSAGALTLKGKAMKSYSQQLGTLYSNKLSSISGEEVKFGGGIPLYFIPDDGTYAYLKINIKLTDSSGTAKSGNVSWQISDKQFNMGSAVTGCTVSESGTVTCNSSGVATITVPRINLAEKSTIWLNMYAATDGYVVSITSASI